MAIEESDARISTVRLSGLCLGMHAGGSFWPACLRWALRVVGFVLEVGDWCCLLSFDGRRASDLRGAGAPRWSRKAIVNGLRGLIGRAGVQTAGLRGAEAQKWAPRPFTIAPADHFRGRLSGRCAAMRVGEARTSFKAACDILVTMGLVPLAHSTISSQIVHKYDQLVNISKNNKKVDV